MKTPPYICCPRCGSKNVVTIELEMSWWYQCNDCDHALTYEEVMTQERHALDEWMHRQAEITSSYIEMRGNE